LGFKQGSFCQNIEPCGRLAKNIIAAKERGGYFFEKSFCDNNSDSTTASKMPAGCTGRKLLIFTVFSSHCKREMPHFHTFNIFAYKMR